MPIRYFWVHFMTWASFVGSGLSLVAFVVLTLSEHEPQWALLAWCGGFASQGLFWNVLGDIGTHVYALEREQTFLLRWMQQDKK